MRRPAIAGEPGGGGDVLAGRHRQRSQGRRDHAHHDRDGGETRKRQQLAGQQPHPPGLAHQQVAQGALAVLAGDRDREQRQADHADEPRGAGQGPRQPVGGDDLVWLRLLEAYGL
jgi:hypothetical protein